MTTCSSASLERAPTSESPSCLTGCQTTRRSILVLPDGARGPGGSCFTEQNVDAPTGLWSTTGGILIVLVPDTATDITVEASDGTRRTATATSNLVVADRSDTVRYSVSGKQMTVAAAG